MNDFFMLKRLIIGSALVLVLLPGFAQAMTDAEFQTRKIQLYEQIISLLTTRLHYLLSHQGIVLGASTSESQLPGLTRRSGGGGGGGLSPSSAPAPVVPLTLAMNATGTSFSIVANKPLDPESVSLFFDQDVAEQELILHSSTTLQNDFQVTLIRQPDHRTFSADLRARLTGNELFAGNFEVGFPASLDNAELGFVTTIFSNGVSRQSIMHKFNAGTSNLTLSASSSTNNSLLVVSSQSTSEYYSVVEFVVTNSGQAPARLNSLSIPVSTTSSTLSSIISSAKLTTNSGTVYGAVSTSIDFALLGINIAPGESQTLTLYTAYKPYTNNYPLGTQLIFTVDPARIDAVTSQGVQNGIASVVSGNVFSSRTYSLNYGGITVAPISVNSVVTSPSSNASDTYATFTIRFNVSAIHDDVYIATTSGLGDAGVNYAIVGNTAFTGATSSLISVTNATLSSGYWKVISGSTAAFTLSVSLNPDSAGTHEVDLTSVQFASTPTVIDRFVYSIDTSDTRFKCSPVFITN